MKTVDKTRRPKRRKISDTSINILTMKIYNI